MGHYGDLYEHDANTRAANKAPKWAEKESFEVQVALGKGVMAQEQLEKLKTALRTLQDAIK